MERRGTFALAMIAAAVALTGCTNATSPPTAGLAETVTVTEAAPPEPAETVTETVTVQPGVYVPEGDFVILLGQGASRDDAALATAFIEFALDPSTVPDGLVFAADGVQLGILQRIFTTRTPSELQSRSAWEIGTEDDLYFEAMGPFSAIAPVRQWVTGQDPEAELPLVTGVFQVAVGPHAGCPYPIDGVPPGLESARQVRLTSVGEYVSCAAGWFAVDLFVVDEAVAAVTVELGSP